MANYQSNYTGEQIDDGIAKARKHETSKADTDGYYEGMTVGNAEQLVASTGVEDKAPYVRRTSGGSANIGNRAKIEKIVGGTLVWNQLVQNGNFADGTTGWSTNRGTLTASNNKGIFTAGSDVGSASYISKSLTAYKRLGHKYFVTAVVKSTANTKVAFRLFGTQLNAISVTANERKVISVIVNYANESAENNFILYLNYGGGYLSDGDTVEIENVMIKDITGDFSTAIADHLYSLSNNGGVEVMKKLFPKLNGGYYEYNAGEPMSVKTSAHKTIEFNAYNNATGQAVLTGGDQWQIEGTYTSVSYVNINGDTETLTIDEDGKFTPANNGTLTVVGGNATDTCVHLVWSGYREGDFEKYKEHVNALDSDLELRGIPKLDENDEIVYDGDEYYPDGTVIRRFGVYTITGNEAFATTGTGQHIISAITASTLGAVKPSSGAVEADIRSEFAVTHSYDTLNVSGTTSGIGLGSNGYFIIGSVEYGNWANLVGKKIYFKLATPTEETADPYQETQIVDDFGTEEFIDSRDVQIPVGHETFYGANLRDKAQNAPDSPSANGDYIMRRANNKNTYVPLTEVKELPNMPTTDGSFTLKCTVADGEATLSWGADA